MNKVAAPDSKQELTTLCSIVRELVLQGEYQKCGNLIVEAMARHPHDPEPHNLLGVLLEKEGEHLIAMKHFRASCALDPVYIPSRYNLMSFGTFFSTGKSAFDETDCIKDEDKDLYAIEYDEYGIGRVRKS